MSQQREFPDWEKLYQDQNVESMPWFNPNLDPDLDQALTKLNLHTTSTALDQRLAHVYPTANKMFALLICKIGIYPAVRADTFQITFNLIDNFYKKPALT